MNEYIKTTGNKIEIILQNGVISKNGVNGCQIDDVLILCKEILIKLNNQLSCRETEIAITKVQEAIHWLIERKRDRQQRGVEGREEK
ncbi:MAG: hypothetical protein V3V84_00670 [Candidatus Bathyarchaeia archaeon]